VTAGNIAYTPRGMGTIRQLEALWAYSWRCAQLPAHLPACDSFWTGAAIVAVVVFALIVLVIVRRIVRNLLAVRAERARTTEEERFADPITLAKYKAETDKYFDAHQDENVEKRIRDALDVRRTGVSRKKDGSE
jgi:flagellar biosynthesis/type III secretory pathway M-ring protein FliF/YscJ